MCEAAVHLAHQEGFKGGQYWDTAEPYHYVRTEDHPEHGLVLIVGGEDHQTGIKPSEYEVPKQARCPAKNCRLHVLHCAAP